MNIQTYLIDTNVIIGLEDNRAVEPAFAALLNKAAEFKVNVFGHEASRDDINRDRDEERRRISLSKLEKFHLLGKVRGLSEKDLEDKYGPLPRPNDVIDATLLDAIDRGAADFLVTQDRGLHERARRVSAELGRRVLFVADAVQLLKTTYEPREAPIRFVEEVFASEIPGDHDIFGSLREDYADFDVWWRQKCVKERRQCWIVDDQGIAGIIVRKDERPGDTDALSPGEKILKLCTFKVQPDKRGVKLGELLLKKAFWYAQKNHYDVIYLTTYDRQEALIDLLEYYGFKETAQKPDGELIYEKTLSRSKLRRVDGLSDFDSARLNYPRFIVENDTEAFAIPIKESYHDTLFPELSNPAQPNLFAGIGGVDAPRTPGNTIRKVYLCRAPSNIGRPGSLLFFYKGVSQDVPSQALTAIGVFEECSIATSTVQLMRLAGGRSVYTEKDLEAWGASPNKPVKVINFLLMAYVEPPLPLIDLQRMGVMKNHPPQSIFKIQRGREELLKGLNLDFDI